MKTTWYVEHRSLLSGAVRRLAGCALLTALLAACGSPMTADQATDLLSEQLWSEEIAVQGVCRDVAPAEPSQLVETLRPSDRMALTAQRAVVAEVTRNLGVLFEALSVDRRVCPPSGILMRHLDRLGLRGDRQVMLGLPSATPNWSIEFCRQHLQQRTTQLDAQLAASAGNPTRSVRLFEMLRDSGTPLTAIPEEPVSVARRIDFSSAVLFTLITFSDELDEIGDDLAGQFGFASGVVALVIREVVSELLALTSARLLDELESGGVVSSVALARNACQLYSGAAPRPNVTVHLLRRLILRLRYDQERAQRQRHAVSVYCDGLSERSVCEDVAEELEMEELLEAHEDAQGLARYAGLVPHLPVPTAEGDPARVTLAAESLLDAVDACPAPCEPRQLNQLTSLFWLMRDQGYAATPLALSGQLEGLDPVLRGDDGQIRADIEALRSELADSRAVLDAAVNILQTGEASAERVRQDLITTLSRLTDCQAELDRVRQARIEFANSVLAVTPPVSCETQASVLYASTRFEGVRIPGAVVCDPTQPFDFDIGTDNLFDTCDDVPLSAGVLTQLGAAIADLTPEAVLVIGHADERPVGSRACGGRFSNNTVLSVARAQAVQNVLSIDLENRGLQQVVIQATGVGAVDPRVTCGVRGAEECHRLNRRVTMRLVGATGLDFDLSCVGG